jgi:AraC family ethanolamine operon transcriptional activator
MTTEKLHAVRRVLKTSSTSIAEASKSYGFSIPSRFTRQYKRLFGELPSETRESTARRR